MGHHSTREDAAIRELFRQSGNAQTAEKLGATGEFPQGKLTEQDEGEIRMAVGAANGKVVIDFGQPTAWVGMDPLQARELAASLMEKALQIDLAQ